MKTKTRAAVHAFLLLPLLPEGRWRFPVWSLGCGVTPPPGIFPLGGNLTTGPVKSISSFIFGEHLQHFHGIPGDEKVLKWQGNSATVP